MGIFQFDPKEYLKLRFEKIQARKLKILKIIIEPSRFQRCVWIPEMVINGINPLSN